MDPNPSPSDGPQPPPLPPSEQLPSVEAEERGSGWWCWPVILFSVFLIGWSVHLFASEERRAESGEATVEAKLSASRLALMKLEARAAIAASMGPPREIEKIFDQMEGQIANDPMASAYLLLRDFVGAEELEGDEADSPWNSENSRLRELTRKAIENGITAGEREELEGRVGWFAELAPDAETGEVSDRAEITTRSVLAFGLFGVVFLGAVGGIIVGAILLFLALRKKRQGHRVMAFEPKGGPRWILLECFALYLGVMAAGELLGVLGLLGAPLIPYVLALVVPAIWPFVRGVSFGDVRRSLGWHRGRGIWREVGAGVVGYTAVLAIASVGVFLTLLLVFVVNQVQMAGAVEAAGGEGGGRPAGPVTHPIIGWIYEGGWQARLFALLLAAVAAPLFEEIFFRGALQRYLRGHLRFFASALLTGLIFAALHPQGWMGIPALTAIGVGFSVLREWRDSLIAPMVAHAINNGVLVGVFCFAL